MFDFGADAGLAALFLAAFLSATVLPANSEVVLFAVLRAHPDRALAALVLATIANTLGGMTTYAIGRVFPRPEGEPTRASRWVHDHGAWALLLSWVPIVGDGLCAAAGWVRVPAWQAALAMAVGKGARYLAVAQAAALL